LWLGRNKITELTGLDAVPGLTQLGLQSNRLTSLVPGLAPVVGLRELYVSHNGLTSLEGIGHLVRWWAGAGLLWAMGLGRDVCVGPALLSLESHCRGAGEVVADALLTRYSLLSSCAFFIFLLFSYVSSDWSLLARRRQTQLHTLDVASNRIEFISDMEALVNLREFWVRFSPVSSPVTLWWTRVRAAASAL